jgi:hypothetical protein
MPKCAQSHCVDAEVVDQGVLVTSTIEGNTGSVLFTRDEWDGFIEQVKAGKWDHTIR